jgi:hypothetical protein
MFATLVINAVFMTLTSAVMFALREDTPANPDDDVPAAPAPVEIPRQHGPVEPRSAVLARPS